MEKLKAFWKNFKIEEKLLALYIIALPNMDFCAFIFNNRKIQYADIIFLFLFVIFIWKLVRNRDKFIVTTLEVPLIIMCFTFMLSFLNSVNLIGSFTELTGLLYLIILFILIPNIIQTREKLISFLYIWMITAFIVSLVGLFAFFLAVINRDLFISRFLFYSKIESMAHHFPRIDSLFENANMFLTYLHATLIFTILLFLLEDNLKRKVFILLCLATIFATAFLTGSRRFTGLLLSLFIILCWFGRGKIMSTLKYLTFLGFLFFLIASIIASIWVIFPIQVTKDEITKTAILRINYSYSLHFIQPVASINMIKKHPFIGVGFGTYNRHFEESIDWKWLESSFGFEAYPQCLEPVKNKTLNFDPHSTFLGTLSETGLVGFLGLMYFLLKYTILLMKGFKKGANRSSEEILFGCIFAGLIGFLLNGLTIEILTMRHFWFMIAIGICPIIYEVKKG